MGTASTMACITETLGMALPGTAAIPAVHADRLRAAEATGEAAVALARSRVTPAQILTPAAIENALRVLLAIGGSTNAIIHLTAVAGRVGVPIDLHALNRLSDETPVLVDLKPSGQHYMEDFFAAGGVGAVLRELREHLHLDCLTVTGQTLGERLESDDAWVDRGVIRSAREPFQSVGGLVALFGSLAPGGAILKRSAADARLFESEGRAVVFDSLEDLSNRIDDPALDVKADGFSRAEERRAARRAGDAGGGLPADSHEAVTSRRQGHGADLRRAHERHGLRHDRAPRDPGGGHRRTARSRAERRSDPDVGEGAHARSAGRARAARAARGRGAAGRAGPRLSPALSRARPAGRRRLRLRFSQGAEASRQGRSKSSASASVSPTIVTSASALIAAPSPCASGSPPTVSAPRVTCTHAWRRGARRWVTASPGASTVA